MVRSFCLSSHYCCVLFDFVVYTVLIEYTGSAACFQSNSLLLPFLHHPSCCHRFFHFFLFYVYHSHFLNLSPSLFFTSVSLSPSAYLSLSLSPLFLSLPHRVACCGGQLRHPQGLPLAAHQVALGRTQDPPRVLRDQSTDPPSALVR